MNTFQVSQNYYKKNKIMLSKSKRASTATATATASEFESVQKNEFDVKEKDEGKSTKKIETLNYFINIEEIALFFFFT